MTSSVLLFEFVIPSFFLFFFFLEITLARCWISWPGPLIFLIFALFHVLLRHFSTFIFQTPILIWHFNFSFEWCISQLSEKCSSPLQRLCGLQTGLFLVVVVFVFRSLLSFWRSPQMCGVWGSLLPCRSGATWRCLEVSCVCIVVGLRMLRADQDHSWAIPEPLLSC